MIKQVYEDYKEKVLDILKDEPSRSLFITGDILTYGMHNDFQDVYVDEDEDGIHGIYLRYRSSLVFYVNDKVVDEEGVCALIDHPKTELVSSVRSHIEKLPIFIQDKIRQRDTYLCECRNLKGKITKAVRASVEDAEGIINGLLSIEEFTGDSRPRNKKIEDLKRELSENDKANFIIKEDGKVIANASSTARSNVGLMVVAVYTLKEYRQKGHARDVVSALTKWALEEKLVPCLFYDNPSAGKLYHDLGYVTIDTWVMGKKI